MQIINVFMKTFYMSSFHCNILIHIISAIKILSNYTVIDKSIDLNCNKLAS